jgi:hypothetical protein
VGVPGFCLLNHTMVVGLQLGALGIHEATCLVRDLVCTGGVVGVATGRSGRSRVADSHPLRWIDHGMALG